MTKILTGGHSQLIGARILRYGIVAVLAAALGFAIVARARTGIWVMVGLAAAGHALMVMRERRARKQLCRLAATARTITDEGAIDRGKGEMEEALADLEASLACIAVREAAARVNAERQLLDAQIQRALGMAETEADVLEVASAAIAKVTANGAAELLLADETDTELHLAAFGPGGPAGCPVAAPEGCPAMRTAQTLTFDRPDAIDVCPRLRRHPERARAAACVPVSATGKVIGILHATTAVEEPFGAEQVSRLELVAGHVGSRLRVLQTLELFQSQATTDGLTGLPNRRSFTERANRLLGRGVPASVAIADLDHFKRLNDTFGHGAGDDALRKFAKVALACSARQGGIAARLGGEEFAFIFPRKVGAAAAAALETLRVELASALEAAGGPRFTASIGIASAPAQGSKLEDLLAAADRALYEAKAGGRDRIVVAGIAPDELSDGPPISFAPRSEPRGSVPPPQKPLRIVA